MRFGMFLCWGPVSLTGKEIGWSRGAPAGGRRPGMRGGKGPTPAATYDTLYTRWKPEALDAEKWVLLAKAAGMKYMIFLVKHHDGFSLYDTKLSDHKSTGPGSAWKVDVMKQVADACHKHDLKLNIYYSQPDWHHPDYLTDRHGRYVEYLHGQIRELLTNYGCIDGLWFDNLRPVGPDTTKLWEAERLFRMARSLQPRLIINNRCGLPGDYDTPEQSLGKFEFDRPWESCITLGTQWSWKPGDTIKPLKEAIDILVSCAGRGGNLALNTNPMPDGRIEARQAERFRQIGAWLGKYGESIYGTRGGPYVTQAWGTRFGHTNRPQKGARPWGVTTRKGSTLYVHVLQPKGEIRLPSIGAKVKASSLLTGGTVEVSQESDAIVIRIPKEHLNDLDTIVKLEMDRPLDDVPPTVAGGSGSLATHCAVTASGSWSRAHDPSMAFDDDPSTRWGGAPETRKGWLEMDLGRDRKVGRLVIDERSWDRIQSYDLQAKVEGAWKTIVEGTTVGASHERKFAPVTARRFRLRILESSDVPTIWEVQLFEK
jgi:alpha-L-fucosidase